MGRTEKKTVIHDAAGGVGSALMQLGCLAGHELLGKGGVTGKIELVR
jgi:NADPH-dependent curcumin reductase CurA